MRDVEHLFYFLEIRGGAFRELDASAYPVATETAEFDSDEMSYVREANDSVRGVVYAAQPWDWSWAIEAGDEGFVPIAGAQVASKQARAAKKAPATKLRLHRFHGGDCRLVDRIRRPTADTLERAVFLLSDGVHALAATITYERFAVLAAAPAESVEPTVEIAVMKPRKQVKRAPRSAFEV